MSCTCERLPRQTDPFCSTLLLRGGNRRVRNQLCLPMAMLPFPLHFDSVLVVSPFWIVDVNPRGVVILRRRLLQELDFASPVFLLNLEGLQLGPGDRLRKFGATFLRRTSAGN